ncbi:hypothetical protein ASE38_03925 [Cellulomonas sp. Root930]|nr:hypothetical protein ASE38_03925 [Cellulomonas sp. Root930]
MADDDLATRVWELAADRARLDELVAALGPLTEKERKAAWPHLRAKLEGQLLGLPGSVLVVLGFAGGPRQVADVAMYYQLDRRTAPLAVAVLTDRSPAWLAALPAALLRDGGAAPAFPLLHALAQEGCIPTPDAPEYAMSMLTGLLPEMRLGAPTGETLVDRLRGTSGILDDELWRLFVTERSGRVLARVDDSWSAPGSEAAPSRPDLTWQHAILELSREGRLERDRLLDATLGTFSRDWAAVDLTWFVRLHDALAPTSAEVAARVDTYVRLLAMPVGSVVGLALRRLAELRPVTTGALSSLAVVLGRPEKGSALAALALLDRIVEAHPELAREAASVASVALQHRNADVRERATTLTGPPEPPSELPAPAPARATIETVPTPVVPVADADELLALFVRLLEDASEPVDVERALEGVARLARSAPAAGTAALVSHAREVATVAWPDDAWSGTGVRADLAALALVWLDGADPGPGYRGRPYEYDFAADTGEREFSVEYKRRPDWSLAALLTLRIHEVARSVSTGGAQLLSLPTTTDGAIPAAVLSARLGSAPAHLPLDHGVAMLRVPPEQLSGVPDAQADRLRAYAPRWERVVGSATDTSGTVHHGIVAWVDRESAPGSAGDLIAAVLDRSDPLPGAALEAEDGIWGTAFAQVTASWPWLVPHRPDLLAAHLHPRLWRSLTREQSAAEPVLAALGRSTVPVGPVTCSALVLGMAANNPVTRTVATDALIDLGAAAHPQDVASEIGFLLAARVVVGSRLLESLLDASQVDPALVLDILVATLPAVVGRRDAGRWVDAVAALATSLGRTVDLPAAFRDAAAGRRSSALARACRRVPLGPSDSGGV